MRNSRLKRSAVDAGLSLNQHCVELISGRMAPFDRTVPESALRRLIAGWADSILGVVLFGSAARGDDDEASDIDFLVRLEPGRTLLDLVRLETKLEQLLGRPVDVVTEASLAEGIRSKVLREAVIV